MLESSITIHPALPLQSRASRPSLGPADEADKLRNRKQRRTIYEDRRAAGLCGYGYCSKNPESGHAVCATHRTKMCRRAAERRKEREASGICSGCGKLPQFWGKKCILCRQLYTKDPLPAGAKRALREYRRAEAKGEQNHRDEVELHTILELIGSRRITGDAREVLRLYAGIEFGKRRTYGEVGKLMNLSRERVRQLLLPAKMALTAKVASSTLPTRSKRSKSKAGGQETAKEFACPSCRDNRANILKDGSYIYKESGLTNVVLLGLETHACSSCKRKAVTIPLRLMLHRVISEALILKKGRLIGKEVRFLRTTANLSEFSFADRLETDVATLRRWEESKSLRYRNDISIRLLASGLLGSDTRLKVVDIMSAAHHPSLSSSEIEVIWLRKHQRWTLEGGPTPP